MFTVNEVPILSDELDIILELRSQLNLNGIDRLRSVKRGSGNIQVTCPVHGLGRERKPSCGISTQVRVRDGVAIPAGTVHCFSCGYTATLSEFISHCFNKNDYGSFGTKWLIKNFQTIAVEDRKPLELDLSRTQSTETLEFVHEDELDSYRFYHDYMWTRGLNEDIVEKFDVGYDPGFTLRDPKGNFRGTFECITFPVRNLNGDCLFVARRAIEHKFFHYPANAIKPVYGLYELNRYASNADEVIICESILNALSCWVNNKPAVALLGLGTVGQFKQLLNIPCRKFITGFDPDNAGAGATQKFKDFMGGKRIVTSFLLPENKDLNDLTKNEFETLVDFF